jgi:REP element-mobilizing transposase RayT
MVNWCLKAGQPDLSAPERSIVVSAIRHFDDERYGLHAFVVMNDHAHVIVTPKGDHELEAIVQSWKSFTANRMQRVFARVGVIWQDEYYDRILRNVRDYQEKVRYILENPTRRWPRLERYPWVGLGKAGAPEMK